MAHSILGWMVIGIVAGWLTGKIMKGWASAGSWTWPSASSAPQPSRSYPQNPRRPCRTLIVSILISTIGADILTFLIHLFTGRRAL